MDSRPSATISVGSAKSEGLAAMASWPGWYSAARKRWVSMASWRSLRALTTWSVTQRAA